MDLERLEHVMEAGKGIAVLADPIEGTSVRLSSASREVLLGSPWLNPAALIG